ncbi:hypothetical protein Lalb_Chr25g0284921 [Lupinus albus]|uniref:Uncharacterized protein n=1 Tax=Lupinus albus TaxID=3870 RepID=A0A6A4MVC5_LUPAL|nr:hypothetical protein Lalb_Chr25g0284921 [Lupinus albus]
MNVVFQRVYHPQLSLRHYIHATISGLLPFLQKVDGTWEITVYFRPFLEYGSGKGSDLWIPTDTTVATAPLITNIKSMSSEPLCLQLYLEHPSLSESRMDALTRHPMHI